MAGDTTPPGEWQNAIPATAITAEVTVEDETEVVKLQDLLDQIEQRLAALEEPGGD